MIEPELAVEARSLLSNVIVMLVEEEHGSVIASPPQGGDEAHAERLRRLGSDMAAIATAMSVILRRSRETADVQA